MTHAISRLVKGLAFAGLMMLIVGQGHTHDAPMGWAYEPFCCNGDGHTGDCQRISAERVRVTPEGYELEIGPGHHRLVTVHHLFKIAHGKERRSQDGDYHLCLFPDEYTPRCFYAPDMGF